MKAWIYFFLSPISLRCFATPVLADRKEMNRWARLTEEERKGYVFDGTVTDVPQGFKVWVEDNQDRIAKAKTMPYFLKENENTVNVLRYQNFHRNNSLSAIQKQKRDAIKEQMCAQKNKKYDCKLFTQQIVLPNRSVREWVNQPHFDFDKKNELLLNIKDVLKNCKQKKEIPVKEKHKDAVIKAFALPITISNRPSWIIIHETKWHEIKIYGISDSEHIFQK